MKKAEMIQQLIKSAECFGHPIPVELIPELSKLKVRQIQSSRYALICNGYFNAITANDDEIENFSFMQKYDAYAGTNYALEVAQSIG